LGWFQKWFLKGTGWKKEKKSKGGRNPKRKGKEETNA